MALPAQMPPRERTLNSLNVWLCKLDFSLENTYSWEEGYLLRRLGGKDLVGRMSPDKDISTLRHP